MDLEESPLKAYADHGELDANETAAATFNSKRRTPVPVFQLSLVACYRSTHTLLYFVIFPFVNPMLVDLGVSDIAGVGVYSGALEGVAAVFNLLALLPWAWVSDHYGRRPAILVATFGACACSALFGFGQQYAWLFVLRALLGFFTACQGAVTRVQGVELSAKDNVAQCIIYVSLGFQLGSVTSPAIGSLFANPADKWSLFAGTIFQTYPYALPSCVAILIPGTAAVIGVFCLWETRRIKPRNLREPKESFADFFTPKMRYALLCNFATISILGCVWTLEVLIFFTPRSLRGLELTPGQMAFYLASKPFGIGLFQLSFFSKITAKYNLGGTLRLFSPAFPLVLVSFFLLSLLNQSTWFIKAPLLLLAWCSSVAADVPCCTLDMVASNRCAHEGQMATATAMMELAAQLGFAIAAPLCGSLFAYSIRYDWLGGYGVWLVTITLSLGQVATSFKYKDMPSWMDTRESQGYEVVSLELE